MKSMMKSKIIAVAAALAMVFTLMPQPGMTAHAAAGDPAMITGADVLKSTSNTKDAQTVYMADKAWRVIGYGAGTADNPQVASSADTMTLISAGNLKTGVQFRADQHAPDANHYSKSNLKTEVDTVAGTFSAGEKAGIEARDLASGSYNGADTDCIAGDEVKGALLWPLSTKEANAMNGDLHIVDPEEHLGLPSSNWWLRSPGDSAYKVAIATGEGDVLNRGYNVIDYGVGLRPAFNYNLKSVIFTSAAAGGKPSEGVGAGSLTQIGENASNEWKLTVKDDTHKNFIVYSVTTKDGKNLKINYGGAVKGDNEYISAIIKSNSGNIKYYGKLALASDEDGAKAEVNIEGKMSDGDTLCIFNEKCNGDYKTDFSSALQEATIDQICTATIDMNGGKIYDHNAKEWVDKISEDLPPGYGQPIPSVESMNDMIADGTFIKAPANSDYIGAEVTDKEGTKTYNPGEDYTLISDATIKILWKEREHQHQWAAEWKKDKDKHWHECTICHVKKEEASHTWDSGKVTKKATTTATGSKTYTCTVCKAVKTEIVPKLGSKPGPKTTPSNGSGTLLVSMTAKKKSITISWNRVQGADGYDIFFGRCNHGKKKTVAKKIKSIKGNSTFKWTKSGLKKGTAYKAHVKAYAYKNGKKKYIASTPRMHAFTGSGTKKYTNAKSVSVNKTKVTLKKGKTFKIKAKVKKVIKKKKLMSKGHTPVLRYATSDKKIAAVSRSGKITARNKGTCYVKVYAHNGASKQIKVTVN